MGREGFERSEDAYTPLVLMEDTLSEKKSHIILPPIESIYSTIDVTGLEPFKDVIVFGHNQVDLDYFIAYPWQGEDTLKYCYNGGVLEINGKTVGIGPDDVFIPDSDSAARSNILCVGCWDYTSAKFPNLETVTLNYTTRSWWNFTYYFYDQPKLDSALKDIDLCVVTSPWFGFSNRSLRMLASLKTHNVTYLELYPAVIEIPFIDFTISGFTLLNEYPYIWPILEPTSYSYPAPWDYVPIRFPRKGFENLRRLVLWTPVHSDLRGFANLGSLRVLELHGGGIDDRTVKYIKGLKNLKLLDITHTKISRKAYYELKKALPDCLIKYGRGRVIYSPY